VLTSSTGGIFTLDPIHRSLVPAGEGRQRSYGPRWDLQGIFMIFFTEAKIILSSDKCQLSLPSAGHCAMHLPYAISFAFYKLCERSSMLVSSFPLYRWRNWGPEGILNRIRKKLRFKSSVRHSLTQGIFGEWVSG
jgi:hypothetical protein